MVWLVNYQLLRLLFFKNGKNYVFKKKRLNPLVIDSNPIQLSDCAAEYLGILRWCKSGVLGIRAKLAFQAEKTTNNT